MGPGQRAGAPWLQGSEPMIEAGAPSTGEGGHAFPRVVPAPPGVVMGSPPAITRNASRTQSKGRATEGVQKSAAKAIIEAGVLHLERRGLILRESSYNVVTRAPTVGNDSVVLDSKRERGDARYALLGTRSAGSQSWRW
jgi:hypothetical protein